jgi:hypothetical protein
MGNPIDATREYLKDDPSYAITGCPVCDKAGRPIQGLYKGDGDLIGCGHCGEHQWAFYRTALGPAWQEAA